MPSMSSTSTPVAPALKAGTVVTAVASTYEAM